ncbi:hypothetical protein JCM12298_13740 [Desulfothermus naphthae]
MVNCIKNEKRSSKRRKFKKPVYVEQSILENQNPKVIKYVCQGIDISQNGIGLISKHYLKEGSIVRVIFFPTKKEEEFFTFAKTVWSKKIHGSYRVGLNFLS